VNHLLMSYDEKSKPLLWHI